MLTLELQNQDTQEWVTLKEFPSASMPDYSTLHAEGDLIADVPSTLALDGQIDSEKVPAPTSVTLRFWAPDGEAPADEPCGLTLTLYHQYAGENIIPGYAFSRLAYGNARLRED